MASVMDQPQRAKPDRQSEQDERQEPKMSQGVRDPDNDPKMTHPPLQETP